MTQEQIRNDAATLARLAAITVPDERLPSLAAGLAGTRAVAAALAKYDYGLIEPACRFEAPGQDRAPTHGDKMSGDLVRGQGWGPSPRGEGQDRGPDPRNIR